jgi:hypothetical protein
MDAQLAAEAEPARTLGILRNSISSSMAVLTPSIGGAMSASREASTSCHAERQQFVLVATHAHVDLEIDVSRRPGAARRWHGQGQALLEAQRRLDQRQYRASHGRMMNDLDVIGVFGLGQHHGVNAGLRQQFQVGREPRPYRRALTRTMTGHGIQRRRQRRTCGILVGRRDGIFEIDDHGVGAGRQRLVDALGAAGRERREVSGAGASCGFADGSREGNRSPTKGSGQMPDALDDRTHLGRVAPPRYTARRRALSSSSGGSACCRGRPWARPPAPASCGRRVVT